jgi:hypothetical protein
MGDFFESIFWVIIILVWISSIFSKAKKAAKPKEGLGSPGPKPDEDIGFEKEIFRSFGFPSAQKQYQAPKPKVRILPQTKKEAQLELKDAPRYKHPPEPAATKPAKKETPALVFSADKLQEGIILAEILGPPKAHQFRRGVGTGIRSGLKNRWP